MKNYKKFELYQNELVKIIKNTIIIDIFISRVKGD